MTTTIYSLNKAVEVLRIVASEQGVALGTVISRLGLPKTTTHRLLINLERTGLVERMPTVDGTLFVLGPLITELAGGFANWQRLVQVSRPAMERLRDRTGETVLLHVFEGSRRIVVDQVESLQELRRTYRNLGVPVPLYGGAASKVFLASLPLEEVRRHWSGFPASVTDRRNAYEQFLLELQRVRKQGYAITVSEITPGVTSIAMGIARGDRRVMACVSVTGPVSRLSVRELRGFVPALSTAVREINAADTSRNTSRGARPAAKVKKLVRGARRGGDESSESAGFRMAAGSAQIVKEDR